MVVIILVLMALGVAAFIMLSDTRKNDKFKLLDQGSRAEPSTAPNSDGSLGHDGSGGDD